MNMKGDCMNGLLRVRASLFAAVAFAALALSAAPASLAQDKDNYPNRPIRIVIGFAAGGGTDSVLRAIAGRLAENLGVPVLVDNKPGANGNIAGDAVSKSPADGYTLLYNTSSLVLSPHLYAKLNYDFARDLMPVALTANIPLVLVTHPSVPVTTVQESWLISRPIRARSITPRRAKATSPTWRQCNCCKASALRPPMCRTGPRHPR